MITAEKSPVERLILDLTAFNPRSKSTLVQYRRISTLFLGKASNPPTRDDVLSFIADKKAQSYKSFCYFILRRLFTANEWEWPFPPRSAPQVREQNQVKMPTEMVGSIVQNAGELSSEQLFYLAVSTTYGLRRAELASLTRDNLIEKGTVLSFPTVKGGAHRTHVIPEQIYGKLKFPKESIGIDKVGMIFKDIIASAGQEAPQGAGWHAIRRSLISELSLKCPAAVIVGFMGWQSGPGSRTFYTYSNPDFRDVDMEVVKHHPFLKFWEDI